MSDREKFRLFKKKYKAPKSILARANLSEQIERLKDYVPEKGCILGNHKYSPLIDSKIAERKTQDIEK